MCVSTLLPETEIRHQQCTVTDSNLLTIPFSTSSFLVINIFRLFRISGPRDVKTFVDLLSISAGESDYERDRVACLHTCCLEFEPIIFHLNEKSGPKDIISSCEKILAVLEKDPDIMDKLVSSCDHFLWIFV